ncbi:MAG: hypothetical protein C0609_11660 [Deltaproteobacteria bacterium]|nr:MAG: hypothetical protein C0609_11660 [Deltaproteobacteria bacterium]
MSRTMASIFVAVAAFALAVGVASADNCLDGGCHADEVNYKYLHGPLAAEELGMEGCTSCHKPVGNACSADKRGDFEFAAAEKELCSICHGRSTATDHLQQHDNCLDCHSPHGSDDSSSMQR